ncbi:MAG: 16S rRNA (cytosine(1402)-N(4))-methyltransferase RsmH [Candidatus Pacebacteria bacterium]|nr:16S rRNA (cytosine(1402)-N(4))-methyltransferase RsmH [Candidatus Paceibacterota bacterium]
MKTSHITVLLNEAIEYLKVEKNCWYVDTTFGGGGHTEQILKRGGKVIAFDFDQNAIKAGEERFKNEIESNQLVLVNKNFTELEETLNSLKKEHSIDEISGILFDFGTSTDQLMNTDRGFSFLGEGELDMRMDQTLGVKAKDLLTLLSEKQLMEIFFQHGGESEAKKIAKAIVSNRKNGVYIKTNKDLAQLVESVKKSRNKTHPATKVFQALRIVVNDELNNIETSLPQAFNSLKKGGRLITISFHEGEDRIAKTTFKTWQEENLATLITKKPVVPTDEAIKENPRCRSAKMRIIEKT